MKRFRSNSLLLSVDKNQPLGKEIIGEVTALVKVKLFNFEELSLPHEVEILKMLEEIMAHFGVRVSNQIHGNNCLTEPDF